MKIPKSIKIGGAVYGVVLVDGLRDPENENGIIHGKCDQTKRFIHLNAANEPNMQETTFLHELVHALSEIYGITPMPEADVDRLANGLHAVIRQNPGIFSEGGGR